MDPLSLLSRARRLASAEVVRSFVIYGAGAGFLSGISFFLIPIYTRVIAPEEYGLLELLNTGIAILGTLLPLGLRQTFILDYYHHQPEERPKLALNVSVLYALTATPITLALVAFSGPISRAIFQSHVSYVLVIAAALTAFFAFYRAIFFSALRMARKPLPLVSFQVASGLGVAALNIYLVYYRRLGIAAIIGVNLAAVVAGCIAAAAFYLMKSGIFRVDLTWEKTKAYYRLGLPLMPAAVAIWMLSASDRWVLTAYGYQTQLGLYSLAYKFGTLYTLLVIQPFTSAYQPIVFASYREDLEAAERRNTRMLRRYLSFFVPLVIVGFLLGRPIFHVLVGPQYYGAYGYVLPIVLGYVFVGAASIAFNLPLYQKRSAAVASVHGAGALLNVAGNIALVRWYGAWAAAVMTLACFTVTFGLAMWLRRRVWLETEE